MVSPAIAAVNPTINSATPGYTQVPKITGSVYAGQPPKNFMKDNLKVSFQQASEIAAKQFVNSTMVGGHLGVVQGYLVYAFLAVNGQDHTGHMIIVDAGNGKVLYRSQGQQMGSFGPIFGSFGPLGAHGFGGFWHGPFASSIPFGLDNGVWQH